MNDVKVCGERGLITWCQHCNNWEPFATSKVIRAGTLDHPLPLQACSTCGTRVPQGPHFKATERSGAPRVDVYYGVENAVESFEDQIKKEIKDLIGFPIDSELKNAVREALDPVLRRMVSQRPSPISVQIDETNNDEESRAAGILNVKLKFDPELATVGEIMVWDRFVNPYPMKSDEA